MREAGGRRQDCPGGKSIYLSMETGDYVVEKILWLCLGTQLLARSIRKIVRASVGSELITVENVNGRRDCISIPYSHERRPRALILLMTVAQGTYNQKVIFPPVGTVGISQFDYPNSTLLTFASADGLSHLPIDLPQTKTPTYQIELPRSHSKTAS